MDWIENSGFLDNSQQNRKFYPNFHPGQLAVSIRKQSNWTNLLTERKVAINPVGCEVDLEWHESEYKYSPAVSRHQYLGHTQTQDKKVPHN